MKLCCDCKWFIPENASSEARGWMVDACCSNPKIGRDLVHGKPSMRTCESQRHIHWQLAHMYALAPDLWCGPDGKYWEAM